jgi:hypothetical protein
MGGPSFYLVYPGGGRSGTMCPGAPVSAGSGDSSGLNVRNGPADAGAPLGSTNGELVGAAVAGTVVDIAGGAAVGASSGLAGRGSTVPSRRAEIANTIAAPTTTMAPTTHASGTFGSTRILMPLTS